MIFPTGASERTNAEKVDTETYDAVIVGGGICGAIIANELGRKGKRALTRWLGCCARLSLPFAIWRKVTYPLLGSTPFSYAGFTQDASL